MRYFWIPMLQMRKVRHREANDLPKVTQLVGSRCHI